MGNRIRKGRRRRTALLHRFHMWIAMTRLVDWMWSPGFRRFHRALPALPRAITRRLGTEPPMIPRSLDIPELPKALRTTAGVPRDRAREVESMEVQGPLPIWLVLHHEATTFFRRHQWRLDLLMYSGVTRSAGWIQLAPVKKEGVKQAGLEPAELTARAKAKAAELGISAVGVAAIDPLVTFARPQKGEKRDPMMAFESPQQKASPDDRALVCIVEQNWASGQTMPSFRGERAHYNAVIRLRQLSTALAAHLRDLGYTAVVHGDHGANIAYAVAAGLGQLGLNGQLLTPFSGPRIRLNIIVTNAPMVLDSPRDYGVPAICDACKSCVRNCPTGAIRSKRDTYRGVYKAKIKVERCIPIVAQVHGCAICHKVCPVQRYGLPPVIEEFKRTGTILGVGSDELEGYIWPVDGRHYGAGEKPAAAITDPMLKPPGFFFDPARTLPVIPESPPLRVESGGMEG